MPRLALTGLAILLAALAIGLIGKALDLDGVYYPIASIVGLLLIGLTARDRFYGRDLRHH